MKNALITIVLTGFFSGTVFAVGGMDMGAEKGSGGMGMGAGQNREQTQITQDQRFRKIDGDQDGYVSRKEAENNQHLTNNWEKADANSDGKLDPSEFSALEEEVPPGPGR